MATMDSRTQLRPIQDHSLREQAKAQIRRWIISGDIEPGATYRIADFVDQLQVSATPVREALLDLANNGLIQMLPNRGFRVPTLTREDLDNLIYLRLLVEPPSVEKATPLLSSVQRKTLRNCVKETALAAKHEDLHAFMEWDERFHLGLLEPLGNPLLLDIVRRLRDGMGLYRQLYVNETGLLTISATEHDQVMTAVEKQDGPLSGKLMRHHLEHTFDLYERQRVGGP